VVIDSPALLAILLSEPEADRMVDAMEADSRWWISAVQLLETA
jgi:uncharacterized protein with PIN domain